MLRRNRTTRPDGMTPADDLSSDRRRVKRIGVRRTVRAIARLARSRRRLAHLPTVMQVRTMARFEGHAPCSYLLDPAVNFVPELPLGGEDPLGRQALCFTGRDPESGRPFELVTLPDGCAFDLLGIGG